MNAKEIVKEYFDALSTGNVEKAFSYFETNAIWSQPGNNKFSGVKNNLQEIGSMISEMMEDTKYSVVVKPNGEIMQNGNIVAVPVWFKAEKPDKIFDMGGIDLFEVVDEKIIRVWTFSEIQEVEDSFWGKR